MRLAPPLLLALTAACSSPGEEGPTPLEVADKAFPETFLFGAATAGFQVDMGCPTLPKEECADTQSDWYQFVTSPEMIAIESNFLAGDDPAEVGPGHWELYESDFDLAADQLHSNAFRMSIEWSRIFPTSTEGVEGHEALLAVADPAAVAHYHKMFAALKARNMAPLVTIHHYTMPLWIHDGVGCHFDFEGCSPRGWVDTDRTVTEIAKYAGFVAEEFGGEVDLWATQNEPFAVLLPAFVQPTLERTNPPSLFLEEEAAKVAFTAMIEAHARMYDAIHAGDQIDIDGDGSAADVGMVYALAPVVPRRADNALDVQAAENVFYLWNLAFMDGVALGKLDANLDGNPVEREDLKNRLDWLGINFKTRARVQGAPTSPFPDLSPLLTINPLGVDVSEVHPAGLYDIIELCAERYGLPMIITENNGQRVPVGDMPEEERFVIENLSWMRLAMERGFDIRGYFYWSLMDNYEWNRGMSGKKLGLYEVLPDDPAKTRRARPIADVFARVGEARAIPSELAEAHPIYESQRAE